MPQQGDWFSANAPKAAPADDWFASNAPQTAAQAPKAGPPAPQPGVMDRLKSLDRTMGQAAIGAAKGVGNTVAGLGEMVHMIPGVSAGVDALYGKPGLSDASFKEARRVTAPTNTAQAVGQGVEQVGEFFLPTGAVGKGAKIAADVGKSALLTRAQTGSNNAALTSAGITAAIPAVGAAARAVGPVLERSAARSMTQALGATKEWAKAEAAKLAPQMLERGVKGSRPAMLQQAKATAQRVGGELDDAYKTAAAAGETVPAAVIQGNLQVAGEAFKVTNAAGQKVVLPGTERAFERLQTLDEFVGSLGPDIPVDQAAHIKRTWDGIVSKAGLYGQKATASATDSADAWAIREASSSFRKLLNTNPDIAALNKEAAFWTGLKNVLKETDKRTQAQSGGLVSNIAGVVGAASGLATGGITSAIGAGVVAQQLTRALQSPWWRTTAAAPFKANLATALSSGNAARVGEVAKTIAAAMPARASQAVGP